MFSEIYQSITNKYYHTVYDDTKKYSFYNLYLKDFSDFKTITYL